MNVNLDLTKLRMLRTGVGKAAAAAVYREMEGHVRPDALARTPVDTGVLRASILTEQPTVASDSVSVVLGAGGAASTSFVRVLKSGKNKGKRRVTKPGTEGAVETNASGYALIVHEDLNARHTVGEAKYLSNALAAQEPGQDQRIARTIARELGL